MRTTYEGREGLCFENIAIDCIDGERSFWRVSTQHETGTVPWYERSGSFNKDHLMESINKIGKKIGRDDFITEEKVRCRPLKKVLDDYGVQKVDLLHIDAEGYDYEVIKMIPFEHIKPDLIFYENKHLSADDKRMCKELLRSHGYKLIKAKDTFAYQP